MHEIEFWFSIGSTYTYLSVNRALEFEKKENGLSLILNIKKIPKIIIGDIIIKGNKYG